MGDQINGLRLTFPLSAFLRPRAFLNALALPHQRIDVVEGIRRHLTSHPVEGFPLGEFVSGHRMVPLINGLSSNLIGLA